MSESTEIIVRGRCACGKRYRIRNAVAGTIVACPHCGRTISIDNADLRIAAEGERLIPLQPEQSDMQEAILVDAGQLLNAAKGSRIGLTGRSEVSHDEAALAVAQQGGARLGSAGAATADPGARIHFSDPAPAKSFVHDLVRSFYFTGRIDTAIKVMAVAIGAAIPMLALTIVGQIIGFFIVKLVLGFLSFVVGLVVFVYTIRFFWNTLVMTAAGEDVIATAGTSWDWWDDAIRPLFWFFAITAVCGFPAWLTAYYTPDSPLKHLCIVFATLAGSFFWPIAVMSVAISERLAFLRPDWLLRCIVGIGPTYIVAWLAMLVTVGAAYAFRVASAYVADFHPLLRICYSSLGYFLMFYFGYVLFRSVGLLYRHFHERFPWQF